VPGASTPGDGQEPCVLQDRLRSLLGGPEADRIDLHDDRQFDEVAHRLLRRFAHHRDAEAFALLMCLTRGRLLDIATRLAASRDGAASPGALVEALLARLFNDPPPASDSNSFFKQARELMDRLAAGRATLLPGHGTTNGGARRAHIEKGA
jgi:hypothetical protein